MIPQLPQRFARFGRDITTPADARAIGAWRERVHPFIRHEPLQASDALYSDGAVGGGWDVLRWEPWRTGDSMKQTAGVFPRFD